MVVVASPLSSLSMAGGWSVPSQKMTLSLLAARAGIALVDASVEATVTASRDPVDGLFLLTAEARISLPGLDRALAAELVRNTERICPYTKMFRQGIEHVIALASDESSFD